MGAFLLIKKPKGADVEQVERLYSNSIGVFDKKGLPLNKRLVTNEFVIYIFRKYKYQVENVLLFDNDQFIISTGTLIYNGKTGRNALKELYEDFSVEQQEFFSRLLGNYCLIISKEGKLYLVNSLTGLYRVYSNRSKNVISSSFLAVFESLRERNINVQELFEYIFDGALYGDKTLIREIELIDTRSILQLSPVLSTIPKSLSFTTININSSFNEMVWEVSRSLIDYFNIIKDNFGNSVSAALTAGSDTRLMLALMRKVGIEPYLYVYGSEDESNVRIAKMIAEGEGLSLDIEDRSKFPRINKDEFPNFLEKQYYMIDGLGNGGIFDNGSDLSTRFKRIERGQLHLNGAGDLATLYYSLPNKPIPIKSVAKAKYDGGDYSMCRYSHFNKASYFATLVQKLKYALNTNNDRFDQRQLDMLRPFMRAKYWTAFTHMINHQLADALVPYLEPRYCYLALDIPYKYKYLGVFKAALIKIIDPAIAKYPSQYGFSFYDYDKIPARVKIRTFLKYHTPIMLRPYIRAHFWKQENKGKFPFYLTKEYLDTIFPFSELAVSEYVNIDKITNPSMLSRVLSVELLVSDRF